MLQEPPWYYVLKDGDLLKLNVAVSIDGWVADSARTVIIGNNPDPADTALVESARRALTAGIAATGWCSIRV